MPAPYRRRVIYKVKIELTADSVFARRKIRVFSRSIDRNNMFVYIFLPVTLLQAEHQEVIKQCRSHMKRSSQKEADDHDGQRRTPKSCEMDRHLICCGRFSSSNTLQKLWASNPRTYLDTWVSIRIILMRPAREGISRPRHGRAGMPGDHSLICPHLEVGGPRWGRFRRYLLVLLWFVRP